MLVAEDYIYKYKVQYEVLISCCESITTLDSTYSFCENNEQVTLEKDSQIFNFCPFCGFSFKNTLISKER